MPRACCCRTWQFLEELSHEDQTLLYDQPAPHGALFVWLEGSCTEHGPQSWAVLREALAGHDCQALAERLMTGSHAQTEGDEPSCAPNCVAC